MAIYTVHAGHAASGKSYHGAVGILDESKEDRLIKDVVIKYLRQEGHTVYDCTVDSGSSQSAIISAIKKKINSYSGVTANISIHLNCFNKVAKGTECCIYALNTNADKIGKRICSKIAALGYTNRGNKPRTDLGVLKGITNGGDNVLVETFFCDNKADCDTYKAKGGSDTIGKAIAEGILNKSISSKTEVKKGIVQLYKYNGTDAQKWNVISNKDGSYSFKNVACGLNMDITGDKITQGTIIQVYTPNNTTAQKFDIINVGSDIRIVPFTNKKLSVDVYGNNNDIGTKIELYQNNDSGAQIFSVKKHSSNVWSFIKKGTNIALDVAGGASLFQSYSNPTTTVVKETTATSKTTTSVNKDLKDLQWALNKDYKFGLDEDGIYGHMTSKAIDKVVLSKATKNKYRNTTAWVQCRVGTKPDGDFGNNTKVAVIAYQKKKKLTADGIVGPKTIRAILKDFKVNCYKK